MPEGFHLIKGNRKDSPKVEVLPIWLRRRSQGSFAALLQLTARKEEHWEMRSLGVIKGPRSLSCLARLAPLQRAAELLLRLRPGEPGARGWERCRTPSAMGDSPLEHSTLAHHSQCHFSTCQPPACVRVPPYPHQVSGSPRLCRTHNVWSRCQGAHVWAVLRS